MSSTTDAGRKANLYEMNFCQVSHHQAEDPYLLVNFDGIRQIMWEPDRGTVDTSGITSAYAAGARQKGAEIYPFTTVTGTFLQVDGRQIVQTLNGNIQSQWDVNTAGLRGREVVNLAGLDLPLQPTEYHYFVTEKIA